MNKLVAVLGTTTVAFAALTAYYAYELAQENKRAVPEPAVFAAAVQSAPQDSAAEAPAQSPAGQSTTAAPVQAQTVATVAPAAAATKPAMKMRAADVDFLAMYADPRGRATLIEEAMADQRMAMRGVQQRLGFTDEEWQRVLEVKAEQSVESRAAILRCRADPDCRSLFTPEQVANQKQALREVIGEDKYAEYDAYMSSMMERQAVAELQKNLSGDLALPEQRAEELIAALADERAQALKEMSANGNQYGGIGVPNGFAYYVANAPTLDARFASAVQYSQRIRDRAATILNGNQLTTFNQMQDQLLATLRAHLARKEAEAAPQPPKTNKGTQTLLGDNSPDKTRQAP